jgi:hypothetical protein
MFQQWGKGRNIVEQWCFSNGKKKGEILLNSGVSAMGKMGKMRKMLLESDEERGSSASQNEAWIFLK